MTYEVKIFFHASAMFLNSPYRQIDISLIQYCSKKVIVATIVKKITYITFMFKSPS